ncbi:MAG: polyphosphate kinase 1 [Oscillospiraceae bacterium]|jgi:polyphosphate kinase
MKNDEENLEIKTPESESQTAVVTQDTYDATDYSETSGVERGEEEPERVYVPRRELCNRELSWLDFEIRVVKEATHPDVPLLEKLRFVSIYFSNLDEFFRVRVGSLTDRMKDSPDSKDPMTGWTPHKQIEKIIKTVNEQKEVVEGIYEEICRSLSEYGVDIVDFNSIQKEDEAVFKKNFDTLKTQLSPQIIGSTHPFPFLQNQEQYVVVNLIDDKDSKTEKIGVVPVNSLPQYIFVTSGGRLKVAMTSEMIQHFVKYVFKKQTVVSSCIVRITRNAEIPTDKAAMEADFRHGMQRLINSRNRLNPVRLQVVGVKCDQIVKKVCKAVGMDQEYVIYGRMPLDFSFLNGLMAMPQFSSLKFPPHKPARNVELEKGQIIPYLEKKDLLLSFPFQSIQPFIDLLYEAADDPTVEAIKITLYRLSSSSKIAAALAYAAERGKDVTCLLELRARFDEQNNIDYSRMLESAGCNIMYGLPSYKVHSKLCLIKRNNSQKKKFITQIGTGNYNEKTAEQYTDLMLITSSDSIGMDAWNTFNALASGEISTGMHSLWVAPDSYMPRLTALMDEQIALGSNGYIAIKCNSMNDIPIMNKMIEASRAGVRVELFIRGICCLIPGIPGITENITVKSVVGRYLEHSRIFVLGRGKRQRVFIGSGDLLERNVKKRVEAFVEVSDDDLKANVLRIIEELRKDTAGGWVLNFTGEWRPQLGDNYSSQKALSEYFASDACRIRKPGTASEKRYRFIEWIKNLFRKKTRV